MKSCHLLLVGIALILLPLATAANITKFTNEITFTSTLDSFILHNFDSFDSDLVLDQQLPGLDFDNAVIHPGCCGGTFKSAPQVILNQDRVTPIIIRFDTPIFAVGLSNSSLVDAERFEIYDSNNNLLDSINLPEAIVNFGGFISEVGIARAEIVPIAPTNGSIFIDDLILGQTNAVPEPTTNGLVLISLVAFFVIFHWKK